MGKINQGILDGFNGKVGTVVGFFWKGKPVMRGYKRFIRDKHSEAQMLVRLRFAALNELASAFHPASLLGFKGRAKSRGNTEGNNFVQLNWDAVTASNTADVSIQFAELQLSAGSLPGVQFGAARFDEAQTVKVSFVGDSEMQGASAQDRVYLFLYSPGFGTGLLSAPALRSEGSVSITVPAKWTGENVHVYGFAVGGSPANEGKGSHSSYLGEGTIG